MYPELFEIPFIHVSVKSYGLMMVIGFVAAVALMKRLCRNITPDPQFITNLALYSLIAGVVGSRLFFIVHHFDNFLGRPLDVFAIWEGGLEFLGGLILAIAVILSYLLYHKLPIRRCLDVLAVGLMLGLAFGRIGCFLNADCYGKPTELPWGVRFPYGSFVYISQINADLQRDRPEPHLKLPREDYLGYGGGSGMWYPKPYEDLSDETGIARCRISEGIVNYERGNYTDAAEAYQQALETLSIIAYKQPIIRAEIEAIRGVQSGQMIRTLIEKGLVKITGRDEVLGRPLLYGTTTKFLGHFGLKSVKDLPKVEDLEMP